MLGFYDYVILLEYWRNYMFKVYNKTALSKHQRFRNALIYGGLTAIGLTIAYGIIVSIVRIQFSIMFIGIGYLIGKVILEKGRGVQPKFSILAGVLAFLSFVIGDMIGAFGFGIFLYPTLLPYGLLNVLISWFSVNSINGLLSLAFRLAGIYFAYNNARVV